MVRLADSDYRKVLEVIGEAAAIDGPIPFPEPVLEALRRLVPCDVVAYHERLGFVPDDVVWVGEPRGAVTRNVREGQKRHRREDPLAPAGGARKFSDFFSRAEFHRLGLYCDVSRPLGVEDMYRIWLDPRGEAGARLEFDRARRDFRERDRAVLDLLLPYLRQFRSNAAARRRFAARRVDGGDGMDLITPREREVLSLVAAGKTNPQIASLLWISSGTVRTHLDNIYEKLGVHTRTAAVAAIFQVDIDVRGPI